MVDDEEVLALTGGRWHGKERCFGLHYDLHAGEDDTELGLGATPENLVPVLEMMSVDFVQTDCKGHGGYTSWFSQTPGASVAPGLRADSLRGWRRAAQKLGLPLHCHYSGVWDRAAGSRHPEWTVVGSGAEPTSAAGNQRRAERMCPRRGYLENLMIPQMIELIDRYGVDGFWVDGDIWAVEPCYCDLCRRAFEAATGIADPPTQTSDPNWPFWMQFTLDSFEEYVTRYCDAVHAHRPGVLVCSNWLQTFRHPGEPKVPTDWISGDNTWVWGLDSSRCEARFVSTRGKPWDIMIWSFYKSQGMGDNTSPWVPKPAQMIQQEAAVVAALGGNVQVYENSGGVRDGRLVPWRAERLAEVGRFVKTRRSLCQDTETIPQVAVLHSENHARRYLGRSWSADVAPVEGAVFSLLEHQYGVDIMDEWALLPRLAGFPVVVAPEQNGMSKVCVLALQSHVYGGGSLLVTGAGAVEAFGEDFLGVEPRGLRENEVLHVPVAGISTPVYSDVWRMVEPTTAEGIGRLGRSPLLDEQLLPYPAATIHKVGQGTVGYIPCAVFRYFRRNRYPQVGEFIAEMMRRLAGELEIRVSAPRCVDVVLRRKDGQTIIHFINRSSGIPNMPNNGAVDEIPLVGPIRVEMDAAGSPKQVRPAFEDSRLTWSYTAGADTGTLCVELERVHIHCAVVVD
jgi:hypothetical protein